MTDNWLERTELLLGAEKLEKLRAAHVLVVGLGGVGAYAAEMIARAGVGRMTVADADTVNPTNINRQLVALHSTVGRPKAEVLAERLRDINPALELHVVDKYIKDEETDLLLDSARFDYAVDAIDTLSPKLALILGALKRGIPLVSSMGAGAKTDPTRLEIEDIPHPPLPAGPHAAQTASQSRHTQRLQSRILRRTGTRRRDDPLRRTEQKIQHGHDLLPAGPLRHRLRLGSRPGSDRRAVSGPQQPSRVQENRPNGCRNGFTTIQKRLDPFFEIFRIFDIALIK